MKNKLGRIPNLRDFDDYGEMDVIRIFDNKSLGSYYKFLVKYEKEYKVRLSEDEEKRYGLIHIEKVKEKQVWGFLDGRPVVADDGFQWLVIVPKYKNYVITMYMDQNRKTILWYIDMIDGQGTDEDGVCFYNDLFLDLIILDSGEIVEDDRDELDMALAQGVISKEQYTRVNETALYLKERLRINSNWILDYCQETMIKIEKEISEDKCKVYS